MRLSTQYNSRGFLRDIPVVSSSVATAAASASESLVAMIRLIQEERVSYKRRAWQSFWCSQEKKKHFTR